MTVGHADRTNPFRFVKTIIAFQQLFETANIEIGRSFALRLHTCSRDGRASELFQLRLVDLPQVLELLDTKPPELHLVLTGRDAHPEVCARAHTVTEMVEVKHAYRDGIEAQQGIDY